MCYTHLFQYPLCTLRSTAPIFLKQAVAPGGPGLAKDKGCSRSSVLQVLYFHCKDSNGGTFLLPPIFFFLPSFFLFWIYWGLFSNKVPHHALSSFICNFTVHTNLLYMVHFMLDTCSLLSLLLSNLFCPASRSAFL